MQIRWWLLHLFASIIVAAVGGMMGFYGASGQKNLNLHETASSVFQVSGTIVALILPTAEIGANFLSRLTERYVPGILELSDVAAETQVTTSIDLINDSKSKIQLAWYACVYAFCSFIFSIVAMVVPDGAINLCPTNFIIACGAINICSTPINFSFGYFSLGASLGSIIIATCYLFQAARRWISLRSLNKLENLVYDYTALRKAKEAEAKDDTPRGS